MAKLKADYQKECLEMGIDPGDMTIDEMIVAMQGAKDNPKANPDGEGTGESEEQHGSKEGDESEKLENSGGATTDSETDKDSNGSADENLPPNPDAIKIPEKVRTKFKLYNLIPLPSGPIQYEFTAVSHDPENKSFSQATPTGTMCLSVTEGSDAHKMLKLGSEVFIDITPAND